MAQITIEFSPQGALGLKMSPDVGQNIVLALGMLETAKVAILEQHKQHQNLVQPATGPLPPVAKV